MKPRSDMLYVLLSAAVLLFAFQRCSDDTPTEPPPVYEKPGISVVETGFVYVTLRLVKSEGLGAMPFALERDGVIVLEGRFAGADTVITDEGLASSTDYRYRLYRLEDGAVADSSEIIIAHTTDHYQQDTTSHDITWEVFNFGKVDIANSSFRDIYALSDDNIWAVGRIQRIEPYDHDKPWWVQQDYNAVHWDGKEWTLHNIVVEWVDGKFPYVKELYAVHGFPSGKFVFVPSVSNYFLVHDGDTARKVPKTEYEAEGLRGQFLRIWGASEDDFYCVGQRGTLAHWSNGELRAIETGTQARIHDIHGNADGHAYTGGWDRSLGIAPLLHIYDNRVEDLSDTLIGFSFTAFATKDSLYAFIDKGFYVQAIDNIAHRRVIPISSFLGMDKSPNGNIGTPESMRGTADNNVFFVGHFENILHYNGKTVSLLNYDNSGDVKFSAIAVTEKHFYAAGSNSTTGQAVIFKGTLH